jgi:hypothetical protein
MTSDYYGVVVNCAIFKSDLRFYDKLVEAAAHIKLGQVRFGKEKINELIEVAKKRNLQVLKQPKQNTGGGRGNGPFTRNTFILEKSYFSLITEFPELTEIAEGTPRAKWTPRK